MSSRRWSGFSEGNGALGLDSAPQPIPVHRLGNDIDRSADNGRQAIPQGIQAAEIGKAALRRFRGQTHDHIHVGIVEVIAARHRSEHGEAGDPGSLKLGFVRAAWR